MSNQITAIHRAIVSGIWRNLSTFEILAELQNPNGLNLNLALGDKEREMEVLINDFRRRVQEAKDCGLEAAISAARDGLSWAEVIQYLERPRLLPSGVVVAFAHKAL